MSGGWLLELRARIMRLPATSYFHPPVFLFTARRCQPPARAPEPRGVPGTAPQPTRAASRMGFCGQVVCGLTSSSPCPRGHRECIEPMVWGHVTPCCQSWLCRNPFLTLSWPGMGRGLCLAGQWVLIPHPSAPLREVPHFLTMLSVSSPRPALGGPDQTPGLATGAHRGESPGGDLWDAASLAGPGTSLPVGSVHPAGGREGNGGNSQTAFKGKSYYREKNASKVRLPLSQHQAGQETRGRGCREVLDKQDVAMPVLGSPEARGICCMVWEMVGPCLGCGWQGVAGR